jgi:hypothetical protein
MIDSEDLTLREMLVECVDSHIILTCFS